MTAITSLGGGHGLFATLRAVRRIADEVTAVVTVADDGGSSGRLRRELGRIPPGDLRMALAALSADDERGRLWEEVLQHRFGGTGALAGHAVGNLIIAGLTSVLDDEVRALDEIGSLLGIGYPPWTGGVVQYVEGFPGGVAGFVARADALADRHGERFRVPESLRRRAAEAVPAA